MCQKGGSRAAATVRGEEKQPPQYRAGFTRVLSVGKPKAVVNFAIPKIFWHGLGGDIGDGIPLGKAGIQHKPSEIIGKIQHAIRGQQPHGRRD